MRMIKGIFYILLFYFVGQLVSYSIGGFVPGSIIGMILLFTCLQFKVVKADDVESVANSFTKNMSVFFIPAGAGLIGSYGILTEFWSSILIICSISTVLVIIVVAILQQYMENHKHKFKIKRK